MTFFGHRAGNETWGEKIGDEPSTVMLPLFSVLSWLLFCIWAIVKDKKMWRTPEVEPLLDNSPKAQYFYQVIVYTGCEHNAGTTSDVTMRLIGTEGTSEPHILKAKSDTILHYKESLERNSVRSFLFATPVKIGTVTAVRIWHDCRGPSPEWYLHRVCVEDLASGEVYFFNCDKWFAVDKGDGLIDRLLGVADNKTINAFSYVWRQRWMVCKRDYNLFLSHVSASRYDLRRFTRLERICVASCYLNLIMFIHALFFNNFRLTKQEAANYYPTTVNNIHFAFIGVFPALFLRLLLETLMRLSAPLVNTKKAVDDDMVTNLTRLRGSKRTRMVLEEAALELEAEKRAKAKVEKFFEAEPEANLAVSTGPQREAPFPSGFKKKKGKASKTYQKLQQVDDEPDEKKGSLDGGHKYTVIFSRSEVGEFEVFELDARHGKGQKDLPGVLRSVCLVLSVIIFFATTVLTFYLYVDFEDVRRVHWMKCNVLAILFVTLFIEPMKISVQAFIMAKNNPRSYLWDWLVPLEQPITIKNYSKREIEDTDNALQQAREVDERYTPVNMRTLLLAYQTSAALKHHARAVKAVTYHVALLVCALLIIWCETKFATYHANAQVSGFFGEFSGISTKADLDSYIRETFIAQYKDQDDSGGFIGFSQDGGNILLSDVVFRQIRAEDNSEFTSLFNIQQNNFTSGWVPKIVEEPEDELVESEKEPKKGKKKKKKKAKSKAEAKDRKRRETKDQTPASAKPPKGAPDDGVDSLEDAWTYQKFWAGRHIHGEFSYFYPNDGYAIHLYKPESVDKLTSALDNNWIDNSTRAVIIEMVLYCDPEKIFTSVQLVAEVPPIGNVFTGASDVRSFIDEGNEGSFLSSCTRAVFCLLAIYLCGKVATTISDIGIFLFMSNWWHWVELANTVAAIGSQLIFTSQISFTEIAWNKYTLENYQELLEWKPNKYSIVGDISAAANCHRWQMAFLGMVVLFAAMKFLRVLSGNEYFETTKKTYFNAGFPLIANTAYLFAVYFGFVHISLILFKRTNDFSNIWRAAQMTMGFTAGMYTSTDLRVIHPWRGGWYIWWQHLALNCVLMNTIAVVLEDSFREAKDQMDALKEQKHLTRKAFRTKFANRKKTQEKLKQRHHATMYTALPREESEDEDLI